MPEIDLHGPEKSFSCHPWFKVEHLLLENLHRKQLNPGVLEDIEFCYSVIKLFE